MTAGKVVAFVPDLMDRAKVSVVLGARGTIVSTSDALVAEATDADLAVVDLDRLAAGGGEVALDVVAEVAARAGRVIGFGSHVERERLEEARALGCDQVLARSAFFAQLPTLLA
jgi:hypothetical protein